MKIWMKKIAVALIAIMTLGMYTPTELLEVDANKNGNNLASKEEYDEAGTASSKQITEEYRIPAYKKAEDYLTEIQEQAKVQSLLKFGPRIAEQVEDEFTAVILPEMEKVLERLYREAGETAAPYYGITEEPANGYKERIFNVTDARTEEDIVRFHVRRDNRPFEGYYFNFHYHLKQDEFQEHYNIGEIYWDKNTPPKWMA